MICYRGKLIEIKSLGNENIEAQCKRVCNENGINELYSYIDTWKKQIWNKSDEYYVHNDILYAIEKEDFDEDEDIFKARRNKNGEIDFKIKYYNGGCGFHEALSYAMEDLVIKRLVSSYGYLAVETIFL